MHHGAIGFLDALPAIVAVHCVIAAADAGDLPHAVLAHLLLELPQEVDAAVGRRVPPVHEAVHENVPHLVLARHAQQLEQVLDVRVHAAVAHKPDQVQLMAAAALHRFEQQRLAEEFAARDQLIDARDVHLDDAPGADIQMAHFAIAHLPFGQADVRAGGVNQRVGKILQQPVVVGLAGEGDGVAFCFGAIAPAVEDGQHDWFGSFAHGRSGYTRARGKD